MKEEKEKSVQGGSASGGKRNFLFNKLSPKVWIPALVVVFIFGLLFAWWVYRAYINYKNLKNGSGYEFGENLAKVPCPLNGVYTTEEKAARRPIAIMVENHTDSRPQSGLSKASLVYETVVESGITRFMAVYVENDPEKIGPVRSARTVFVNLADELNAFYAHCGGSADALSLIKTLDEFYDLGNFKYSEPYLRVNDRYAPHNLYTSTEKLRKKGEDADISKNASYGTWQFKDDLGKEERPENGKATIDFSSQRYLVEFIYDKETNQYSRKMAGEEHKNLEDNSSINVKNLIVQYVNTNSSNIASYAKINGEGKAEIFIDGKKINGRFKKIGRKGRTKYFDLKGDEIKFNRGRIWVALVSDSMNITYGE